MNAPADLLDAAEVQEEKSGWSVEYEITGSLPAVLDRVEALFNAYHPMGYGTQVKYLRMEGNKYEARVFRAASCD
jgi:hypothetical protein